MGLKLICFLILGIFACNKVNQWKQPTKVCFNINIEEQSTAEGKLVFNAGYLIMESFSFDGKREEGSDVYFTKVYDVSLNAMLGETVPKELTFDIPQGIYSSIEVEVVSKSANLPNLVVNGLFENNAGTKYPVRFEFNKTKTFLIEGEDLVKNGNEISLEESLKTNATIWLNPAKWFEAVSAARLDKAAIVSINGEDTILINETINPQIYHVVVAALTKNEQKAVFIREG